MRRIGTRGLVFLSIAAAGVWAAFQLRLTPAELVPERGFAPLFEFFAKAWRPALHAEDDPSLSLLPSLWEGVRNTVVFAAAATSLSILIGLLLGFFGSTAWWDRDPARRRSVPGAAVRRIVFVATRTLIALMRSIHELVWAMLLMSALAFSNVVGVFAIAIPYGGTLAKIYSEMIDEAPRDSAAALRAAGAAPAQVFLLGLLPRALPDMAAYSFYRFECALRASAILGFFGFRTVGFFVERAYESLHHREVWTHLYALFALVVVVDWWSGALRRRLVAA